MGQQGCSNRSDRPRHRQWVGNLPLHQPVPDSKYVNSIRLTPRRLPQPVRCGRTAQLSLAHLYEPVAPEVLLDWITTSPPILSTTPQHRLHLGHIGQHHLASHQPRIYQCEASFRFSPAADEALPAPLKLGPSPVRDGPRRVAQKSVAGLGCLHFNCLRRHCLGYRQLQYAVCQLRCHPIGVHG